VLAACVHPFAIDATDVALGVKGVLQEQYTGRDGGAGAWQDAGRLRNLGKERAMLGHSRILLHCNMLVIEKA
jgi:hypothetical protein